MASRRKPKGRKTRKTWPRSGGSRCVSCNAPGFDRPCLAKREPASCRSGLSSRPSVSHSVADQLLRTKEEHLAEWLALREAHCRSVQGSMARCDPQLRKPRFAARNANRIGGGISQRTTQQRLTKWPAKTSGLARELPLTPPEVPETLRADKERREPRAVLETERSESDRGRDRKNSGST